MTRAQPDGTGQPPTTRRSRSNRRRPEPLRERLRDAGGLVKVAKDGLRAGLPGLLVTAILAGSGTAGYVGFRWVTSSPRFAVSELSIRGNDQVADHHVRAHLAPVLGLNLFRLDVDAVARALAADPWIEDAEIRRELPDRLVIDVTERRAAGVVELDGLYLVDRTGHVFKRADVGAGETAGLPIVTGIERDTFVADPEASSARIADALAVLLRYREKTDRPRIGEIALDERTGLTLITYDDAIAIRLGTGSAAEMAVRLRSFDLAWNSLAPEEQRAARSVRVAGKDDRVTVAFAEARH